MTSTNSSSTADRPQRVVITNLSRSWGGTEQYAVQLAEGLQGLGCGVRFVWGDTVVGERVREAGVPDCRIRLRADGDLIGLWRLRSVLRTHRAEAVILTKWREYLLGGLAAKLARVPLTVVRLGLRVVPEDDLKRRLIFKLADRVVVNAEEIRDALLTRDWIDPSRVRVVHNGIDLARFQPGADGQAFRREIGVPSDALLVGTVGALTPQKDHDLLVRAASGVLAELPEAYFVVVGEGFLRARITARAKALGLAERFLMPGFRRDVRPALAALDLFVLSSNNEGMARVLLEAMACGLPIVATDVSGTRSCVEDGVNGRVVPSRNESALASAILELLHDSAARQRMGAQARSLALDRFAADRMIQQTWQLLSDGLSG